MTLRSKFSPVDYIKREDRVPMGERRPDSGVLVCMVLFALSGGLVGAGLMAWYLL